MVKLYKFLISFGIKGNVDNTLVKTDQLSWGSARPWETPVILIPESLDPWIPDQWISGSVDQWISGSVDQWILISDQWIPRYGSVILGIS